MKLGRRPDDEQPAGEATAEVAADPEATPEVGTQSWDVPVGAIVVEPVVEGEAVELPAAAVADDSVPEPVASEPVAHPLTPSPQPPPATPIGDAPGADGVGAVADPLLDPVRALAAERPEVAVGAAFAGGVLAAMILRRLGS